MHTTLFQDALWISGPALQCIVALFMVHRRLVKQFPVFWSYTVFHVLLSPISYLASRASYRTYFNVYWGAEFVDMIFTLLVIQELFTHVFAPYEAIRSLGRLLFRSAALVMTVLAFVLAAGSGRVSRSPMVDRFISLERSVHVLEIGVLIVLFVMCRVLGMVWQRFAFGIAVGMGLTLSGEAIAAAMRVFLGAAGNRIYIWLEPISAMVAICIWAYYAISVDREVQFSTASASTSQLAEWDRALEQLLTRS